MNLKSFMKDKILTIALLVLAVATIEIFLLAYPSGSFIKIYILVVIVGMYLVGLVIEYHIKRNYYRNLFWNLEQLDEKYLITEIIKKPDFMEGKILKEVLEQVGKSMLENVNKYKYMRRRL